MSQEGQGVLVIPAKVDRTEALMMTAAQINKDAGETWVSQAVAEASLSEPEQLFMAVNSAVSQLLLTNPVRLQQLLYRFDVAERDATLIFAEAREFHAELLSRQLVQQALRKVLYRLHYRD